MSFDAHKNFVQTTVATAPSPATSGTSLVVASGDGALFPSVPFNVTVYPADAQPTADNSEIVRVTNLSTDTLTIDREQEDSSPRTIIVGDKLALTVTAKIVKDIEDAISSGVAVPCPDNANSYKWIPRLSDDGETIVGEWQPV